jgi:hypothetical protein
MNAPLGIELQRYHVIRERLVKEFPDADDETIRDTLEGITDLHEMIAAVIRSALVDEAKLALDAMCEVGLTRLEQPDFTGSARAGSPSLVVIAEDRIPKSYWLTQPPKLDRQAVLAELKRGLEIPGAQMSNPKPVLSVRTK